MFRKISRIIFFSVLFGLSSLFQANAQDSLIRDNHPGRYVVVSGDTLWDISARFLHKPWLWPEVWHVNPQIPNPHLIYPGDVLVLVYEDGRPQLRLQRGHPTIKLSPTMRISANRTAIPAIPLDAIRQFLTESRVVEDTELEAAPYVVQIVNEHVMGGTGDSLYVRAIEEDSPSRYSVYRPGDLYIDPETEEVLGREALFVANGRVEKTGDPATVYISRSRREVLVGDRLLPTGEEALAQNFHPRAPDEDIRGQILAVQDGLSQIGQYQVVVISRGERDGLIPGHVLEIDIRGKLIRDKVAGGSSDTVQLPDELAGYLMVFRTFEKVSYGLIMDAQRAIHLNDIVRTP